MLGFYVIFIFFKPASFFIRLSKRSFNNKMKPVISGFEKGQFLTTFIGFWEAQKPIKAYKGLYFSCFIFFRNHLNLHMVP